MRDTTLIYLHRNAADAAFVDELVALAAADPRFDLVTDTSGDRLPDVAALLSRVERLAEREAHLCGPPAMVDAFTARLRECGIAPRAIHFERFDFR
jgi:ferredoxin-NADP reductase